MPQAKQEHEKGFRAVKGMHDVLPSDQPYWDRLDAAARDIARAYGFSRLEPPILEDADLYKKTSGETSDVVSKEMYAFRTKGGDLLALRPEYTPGTARAYLEHNLSRAGQPQKLFSMGPVFRHDRPQLGRYRQFTQIGFETVAGPNDPIYDAEIIHVFTELLKALRIDQWKLKVNSIGCRVCRPLYKKQLTNYYKSREKELCADCKERLAANPLRLLDCKEASCEALKEKAPNFLDKLCATCAEHFKSVLEYLEEVGTMYELESRLVRGLDYYDRTVFEFYAAGEEEALGAIAAGGRYDYLMEMIGGHLTPAVGGAAGAERLIAVMKARGIAPPPRNGKRVFLAHAGSLAKRKAFGLLAELRRQGIAVSEALSRESLSAQLKAADKESAGLALILGQKEIYEHSVIIRDLRTGLQEAVPRDRIAEEIKKRFATMGHAGHQ